MSTLNTIEYGKVFQKELDKQMVEASTSGWMEENCSQVIYNGGKEIKLPKMSLQGLGDYNRDSGYTDGVVTYGYETFTMSQDRGRRFRLDAMDVDETSFGLAAASVASEFQRTKVIPEIDAYRYSTLATGAGKKYTGTPTSADVLTKLLTHIGELADIAGDEELIVTMARPIYNLLVNSSEIQKHLEISQFKQGEADFAVKSINGVKIIPVSSARMKTAYTYVADSDGGFTPTSTAKDINWIICPKSAPIAVSKTDNVKIITPEINQTADAWDFDYRKYHDLFITDNTKASILAYTKA